MRVEDHGYEVELFYNRHHEYELLLRNPRDRVIARLWADPKAQPNTVKEGDFAVSIWADDRIENYLSFDRYKLKWFEAIDRDEPGFSENTLYWSLGSSGFDWYRRPLGSWESSLASRDGLVVLTVDYGEDNLKEVFEELREEYMDGVEEEAPCL